MLRAVSCRNYCYLRFAAQKKVLHLVVDKWLANVIAQPRRRPLMFTSCAVTFMSLSVAKENSSHMKLLTIRSVDYLE